LPYDTIYLDKVMIYDIFLVNSISRQLKVVNARIGTTTAADAVVCKGGGARVRRTIPADSCCKPAISVTAGEYGEEGGSICFSTL
jgi:hypothetical protein